MISDKYLENIATHETLIFGRNLCGTRIKLYISIGYGNQTIGVSTGMEIAL